MHVEDPYHDLGLRPDSTDEEVKAAWRRLSARWHPDRNKSPHALRNIQRINRALEEIRRARKNLDAEADETSTPAAPAASDHWLVKIGPSRATQAAPHWLENIAPR